MISLAPEVFTKMINPTGECTGRLMLFQALVKIEEDQEPRGDLEEFDCS